MLNYIFIYKLYICTLLYLYPTHTLYSLHFVKILVCIASVDDESKDVDNDGVDGDDANNS